MIVAVKVPLRFKPYGLICFIPPPLFHWVVCVAKFAIAGRLTGAVVSFETNRWREELAYFLLWAAVSREEE